jgi:hypothetical protein
LVVPDFGELVEKLNCLTSLCTMCTFREVGHNAARRK